MVDDGIKLKSILMHSILRVLFYFAIFSFLSMSLSRKFAQRLKVTQIATFNYSEIGGCDAERGRDT